MKKIESENFIELSARLDGSPVPSSLNKDEKFALESDFSMHLLLEKYYETNGKQRLAPIHPLKSEKMEWLSIAAGFILLFSLVFQTGFTVPEEAMSELATSNKVFRPLAAPPESKNLEIQKWKNNPNDTALFLKAYSKVKESDPELADQLLIDFKQLNGISAPIDKNGP
jgi:hypothetical protein